MIRLAHQRLANFLAVAALGLMLLVAGCATDGYHDATADVASIAAGQGSNTASSTASIANKQKLDAILADYVEQGTHPFLLAYVIDAAGSLVYEGAAFNPDLVKAAPDADDWIRIWSMTKLVTTVLTLDLIEEGRLALDDPVARYLPELSDLRVAVSASGKPLPELSSAIYKPPVAGEDPDSAACPISTEAQRSTMTIEHLLTHHAGFYYAVTGLPCIDEPLAESNLPLASSSNDLLQRLADLPLIQHPGDGYHYGFNTSVLGLLLERATGQSLQSLVEERITKPYGIEGLRYGLPTGARLPPTFSGADGSLRLARGGELDIFGPSLPGYDRASQLYLGGEGMIATARGFAQFLQVVFFAEIGSLMSKSDDTTKGAEGRMQKSNESLIHADGFMQSLSKMKPLLEAETIRDMTSSKAQHENDWGYMGYAIWVSSGKRADGSMGRGGFWTGGGYEGTRYWIDPELGLAGVIMTQIYQMPAGGNKMEDNFRDKLVQQFKKGSASTK